MHLDIKSNLLKLLCNIDMCNLLWLNILKQYVAIGSQIWHKQQPLSEAEVEGRENIKIAFQHCWGQIFSEEQETEHIGSFDSHDREWNPNRRQYIVEIMHKVNLKKTVAEILEWQGMTAEKIIQIPGTKNFD